MRTEFKRPFRQQGDLSPPSLMPDRSYWFFDNGILMFTSSTPQILLQPLSEFVNDCGTYSGGINRDLESVEQSPHGSNVAPDCRAFSRWSPNVCRMHWYGCIFENHPVWILYRSSVVYLYQMSDHIPWNLPRTLYSRESKHWHKLNIFSRCSNRRDCSALISYFHAILGRNSRMAQWPTILWWHGISKFSVSCLVNPDPSLGPGFVDFIFLHVNIGDCFHGQLYFGNNSKSQFAMILYLWYPYWSCHLLAHL
jgi:hypothetical protein